MSGLDKDSNGLAALDKTYDIDEMPSLKDRLGSRRVNRIKYAQVDPKPAPVRGKNTVNEVIDFMQGRGTGDSFCEVNDIIVGISRLDHYSGKKGRNIPLSQHSLYMILQCVENINTQEIMQLLKVGERQARVYCRAARLAHKMILRHMDETEEVNDPVIENGFSDVDYDW